MRRTLIASALVAGLLVAAVVHLPARLAGWLLPPSLLVADGYAGTLWRGQAARALVATPGGYFHLGGLRWELSPLSLLLLRPTAVMEAAWADQRLSGTVSWRGGQDLVVRDARLALDAALLKELAPVALRGRLTGDVARLVLVDGLPRELTGRLIWERAAWNAPGSSFALGSYAVDFPPAEDAVRGNVLTLAGPLEAEGSIGLAAGRYRIELTLGSDRPLPRPLTDALALLAAPADGGFRLLLDGDLHP
ncbi:MAG TPA: type II secretion system protein N [Pseudohaliea sp.]|nr:type II secretion system protein N [Pseudohaliea sp.]